MRLGFVRISASLAVVVLMASFQAARGMSAFAAETATFSEVASSLYDFSNQPPLRKLIASGAVVSLGVVYDREVSPRISNSWSLFRQVRIVPAGILLSLPRAGYPRISRDLR
jgi:hypothetical protein